MSTIKMPPVGDTPGPSTPDEPSARNTDGNEPENSHLAHATAEALFHYLVNESDQWQPGTASEVHARDEPDALDHLLAHGPLRPEENRTLITAIRLLHPERFGPAA